MVGEVEGNDVNYALLGNKGLDDLHKLIPNVVQDIAKAVRRVVGFGTTKIIVLGNFLIGCHPIYLSILQTNDSTTYYSNNCLKGLNDFASAYNQALQEAIKQLKQEFPNALIVYGGFYNAFLFLYLDAKKISLEETQRACRGSDEKYNFSMDKLCRMPGVTINCPNADNHLSWNGIYMTQQAYNYFNL